MKSIAWNNNVLNQSDQNVIDRPIKSTALSELATTIGTIAWHRGLVRCQTCGLIYYPRRLSRDEQAGLYGEDYFRGAEYRDYLADRTAHEANFRGRIRAVKALAPGEPAALRDRLLLWSVSQPGPRATGTYEAATSLANRAGMPWNNSVSTLATATSSIHALEPGEVDAFCMWDTIEHLDDPGGISRRDRPCLARWRPAGFDDRRHRQLTGESTGTEDGVRSTPRRISGISPERRLAARLQGLNWMLSGARRVGVARSIGQTVYSLTTLNRARPSLLHVLCERTGIGRITFSLNTRDLIYVIARRRAR